MSDARIETIGFIGLGNIGLPASINLMRSGFKVVGFSLTNMEAFAEAGGIAAASAADAAGRCDVLVQCLPVAASLESAVYGPEGLLKTMRPGATLIELSTYALKDKTRLLNAVEKAGGKLLDCELTARSGGATVAERECVLFISGDETLARAMRPVFDGLTNHSVYLGGFGTSLKLKTVNNLLVAVHSVAAAEAMALGHRAGIDLRVMAEHLPRGAGGSAALANFAPQIAAGGFDKLLIGEMKIFNKYFDFIADLSESCGGVTPLADAARDYLTRAVAAGLGEQDLSAVYKIFDEGRRP